jgi:hypothetical protein
MEDWLAQGFTVFGVHFQNWMPVAAAIVLAAVIYMWMRGY